jgi:hypothetical protein
MLSRWLLFCVALGASWATHARADFNLGATDDTPDDSPPPVTAKPPVAAPTRAPLFEIHAPSAGYGDRPFHLELVTGVATKVGSQARVRYFFCVCTPEMRRSASGRPG